MNEELQNPFSSDEVVATLKQMSPLKSPSSDGFNSYFYQNYWSVISFEVCQVVLNFLNSRSLDESHNLTYIVLIPKVSNPVKPIVFRSISLCNVIYKLAS